MSTATVRFVPFDELDYLAWLTQAIPAFALSKVEDGRWTLAESIAKSQQAHVELLPQGRLTPGHFFVHLQDADSGERVGTLWWHEAAKGAVREAYIYSIDIEAPARRRGYGRAAFAELERVARAHGMQQLGLHVFGHNHGARRLYDSLGFAPTSITMRKPLE